MNRRLLRALQRGGVAARTRADSWSIWRSADRRGRIIGVLNGADVEILRLRNELKPLGDESNQVLIWAGPQSEFPQRPVQRPDLMQNDKGQSRSLLEMLITNCASNVLRERIRKACQSYLADLEAVDRSGHATTMNWQTLAQGRVTKNQRFPRAFGEASASAARQRLAGIHAALGDDDLRFLLKLVVRESSRSVIAKAFGLRPVLAEQRGFSILRALANTYGT